MAIPAIMSIFLTIYFYFEKRIVAINIFLYSLAFLLYLFFINETKWILIYDYEYMLFIILALCLIFSNKHRLIKMFALLSLIVINLLLIKADKDIYDYKIIYQNAQNEISMKYPRIEVLWYVIKANFISINFFEKDNKEIFYIVVRKNSDTGNLHRNWYYYSISGVPDELMNNWIIEKIIR
jgi:hypothetical protein